MDPALTLESAKKAIRQREAIIEQQQVLKGLEKATSDSGIDAIHFKRQTNQRNRSYRNNRWDQVRDTQTSAQQARNPQTGGKCSRCGRERHSCEKCPERDVQCHNCKHKGRYSAQCHQRTVSTVQNGDLIESAFLDTVLNEQKSVWTSNLIVNGKEIPFNLDTGAEVTAVSKETWQILEKPGLQPPNKHLLGPAQQPLAALGRFSCHLFHEGREIQHQAFVVDHLKTNLLGLPAITCSLASGNQSRCHSDHSYS